MSIEEAATFLQQRREIAKPIGEPGSPWQTAESKNTRNLDQLAGQSAYKGRIGARVEPYGVYWLQIVGKTKQSLPLVVNLPELGKAEIEKIPPMAMESHFLFPALRGRDIGKWKFNQAIWVLVLNRSTKREDLVTEREMRQKWSKTYEYLTGFQKVLVSRANYWKFFGRRLTTSIELHDEPMKQYVRLVGRKGTTFEYDVATAPFYSMFNIGPYTFAPYRVCWSRMSNNIKASVVSTIDTAIGPKLLIPTDTATIVPFDRETEAHYFCAIVNSPQFQSFVRSFSTAGRGFGSAGILKRVRIDKFDKSNVVHKNLAARSQSCHRHAGTGENEKLTKCEAEITALMAEYWGIDDAFVT